MAGRKMSAGKAVLAFPVAHDRDREIRAVAARSQHHALHLAFVRRGNRSNERGGSIRLDDRPPRAGRRQRDRNGRKRQPLPSHCASIRAPCAAPALTVRVGAYCRSRSTGSQFPKGGGFRRRGWRVITPMFKVRRLHLLCAAVATCAVALTAAPVSALSSSTEVNHYASQSWTSSNGLPSSTIYAITQDAYGYLWLGTSVGLVRFDGTRFV